jgi:hypothetical protein
MKSIKRLCDDARERSEMFPDGYAELPQIEMFNSKLEFYRERLIDDHLIGIVELITGRITNRRMSIRCESLRIAVETAWPPPPKSPSE